MRYRWLIIAGAFIAAQIPALAQDKPVRAWPSQSQRWAPPPIDCTCRAQGRDFQMGETACLRTAEGDRLAVCGMVLNNSSWNVSNAPCTTAGGGQAAQIAAK